MFNWTISALLPMVLLSASHAVAQQRAADSAQVSIELAVARYVEADTAWWARLGEFALDPLVYVLTPPAAGSKVAQAPRLEPVPSRSEKHLAELSRALGTKVVLQLTEPCWPIRPEGCRMGAHHGVVGFSPAILTGTSATLTLFHVARNAGGRTPILFTAVQSALTRSEGDSWQVKSVRVGAG
jgi:hypothetical protein